MRYAPHPATLLLAIALASSTSLGSAMAQQSPAQQPFEQVATFDHQVTGVAVSQDGRIFVNFPRWTEDSPVSVAEVMKDGSLKPYPDQAWNEWRNARKDEMAPQDHWVCVQSVVADSQGNLWVLDPAAPAQDKVVAGGPKLVKIDLKTNQPSQTISFTEEVAPQGSYLNDVRFSPDGRHAYLTDSGVKGALIVVDLQSGKARRVLDGHPSTQVEKDVQVKADGQVLRRPDGRGVEFAADGIALTPDGRHLYWQAIKGKTLYRIATDTLENAQASDRDVAAKVETIGENGVADGLLITRRGDRMIVTAPEDDALKVRVLSGAQGSRPTILVQDKQLRWPDSLAEGPDGTLYFTTSRIQDSATYKPDAPKSLPTQLWRMKLDSAEATGSLTSPAQPQQ
ncbi:SMP-30/gluconolactonase/LRE family protein [Microvirga sesbaniae]|uniref:SMP-30/gluconolactonase/LRE family protein n=1 Tax=Microvirga sesbaniae TaxID=681392 RepID=UPI0021CACAA3|nr:major royal jelly family protein [Microvirga sp. HBU67692]